MSEGAERRIKVSHPGEGRTVEVVGDTYRFLGVGGDTDQTYAIVEATVAPGSGPPLHYHTREEEGFYVLEGEVAFTADGETVRATPGTFLNLPKDSRHSFENVGDRPARMLIVVAPAGIEDFFVAVDRQPPEVLIETAPRYGLHILPQGH
jgi:quercetin dioxygenase-like cupin family protein